MRYPEGKTPAEIKSHNLRFSKEDVRLVKGDVGYIDGYVTTYGGRPAAIFVRNDGAMGLVELPHLKAKFSKD